MPVALSDSRDKFAGYLLSILPEEILLQIFSHLDWPSLLHVRLVNPQWSRLSNDHRLLLVMGETFLF